MDYSIIVTSDPEAEPVTLTDLANHVRNDVSNLNAESGTIAIQIAAARQSVEELTGRALITRTQRLDWNESALPWEILIPDPPLIAVSSFAYTDSDGDAQTLVEDTDFLVDTASRPGRLKPFRGLSWPALRDGIYGAAQITYTAGYGTASTDVPARLRQAVLMIAGHWYKFREPIIVGTISTAIAKTFDMLIEPFVVHAFGRRVA